MSAFLDELRLAAMRDSAGRPLLTRQGRQLWRVLERFRYQSDAVGLVEVEEGFVTDLCSQPRITMSLLGECAQEPAVVHDYAYSKQTMPRAQADAMLYEACILTGIPSWKAKLIYWGVRVGGASHWGPDPAPAVA